MKVKGKRNRHIIQNHPEGFGIQSKRQERKRKKNELTKIAKLVKKAKKQGKMENNPNGHSN